MYTHMYVGRAFDSSNAVYLMRDNINPHKSYVFCCGCCHCFEMHIDCTIDYFMHYLWMNRHML